ncbi:hypothetical protein O3M35_007426 [Rhynocoris fuscipes]|uniref:Uncharacterized protein n=1 Tax=Rhynocoris fuscipes TaxID=488301 RepID=A0AAW1D9D7_9HEMI
MSVRSELLKAINNASNNSGLLNAKIASLFILGIAALICAVLPIILVKKFGKANNRTGGLGKKTDLALGLMLRLGGGVLLATTFLHLLPEVREGLEDLIKDGSTMGNFPVQVPEFVMCIGFFAMYAIEEVAHKCLVGDHKNEEDHHHAKDASSTATIEAGKDEQEGHSHVVVTTPVRGILIIIALSIHQIFEGLAVGLESDTGKVWVLLSAIAAHKLIIAICVGAEMASARTGVCTATICVAVFAIASPIGIAIGIGLSTNSSENDLVMNTVSVILQGLATGTLLYVVFFEVLRRTEHSKNAIMDLIATLVGFVIMLILLCCYHD